MCFGRVSIISKNVRIDKIENTQETKRNDDMKTGIVTVKIDEMKRMKKIFLKKYKRQFCRLSL